MKLTFKFLMGMVTLFLLVSFVNAQKPFEGKVKYKMYFNQANDAMEMAYFIKGSTARIEMQNEGMEQVMLIFEDKMVMLIPDQNMYMEFNKTADEYMDDYQETHEKPIKTNETKTILGYKCEKWIVKSYDNETEIWLTEGLGNYMFMGNPMDRKQSAWQKSIMGNSFFPLLVITRDEKGKEIYKQEVTEIKAMSLSADMFQIPSGYQKMNMPSMPVMPQR